MYTKKSVVLARERTVFHLKSLKTLFWVPLIILNVILPVLNGLVYAQEGLSERFFVSVLQYAQIFIPFCSVWWVLFIAREYVDTDGNELFFVTKNKNKLTDYLIPFLLLLLNVTILYCVYMCISSRFVLEYVKMVMVCVSYFCATYFFIVSFSSITIALLFLLLYTIANIVFFRDKIIFMFYYTLQPTTNDEILHNYLPLLLAALFLLVCGILVERFKRRFN